MSSRNWLHLLALLASCLWLGTAQAVTLYADYVPGSSTNDWINESYAEGPPDGDTPQHRYSTNDVANSPDILWATIFDTFNLPANHSITSVKVDVYCRYDSGSSNRRVELHTQGIPGNPSHQSPAWTQSDESFAWRMGDGGWDITGLHDWTEARINNLRLGVKRIGGSAGNTCRVDAIRIVVQTSPATGNLWINGLYTNGDGLYYWNWPTPANPGETLTYTNFTFTNNGTGPLTWSIPQPQDSRLTFSPSSMTLAVGQSVWMTATFACNGQGDLAPTPITIVGGGGQRLAFSAGCAGAGTGVPQITGLDFDEDDGSYGYYFDDDETSHSFRITNVGNGQLAGTISGSGDNRLSFTPSGYSLQPGQFVDITANFGCGEGGDLIEDEIQLGSGNIILWFMADCEAVEPPGEGVCQITELLYDSEMDEFYHVFQEGETTHTFQITNTGDGVLSGTIDTPEDERLSFSVSNYSLQPGQGIPVTVLFQGGSDELWECCLEVSDLVYVGFYSVSSDLEFDTDPFDFPETELGQMVGDAFTVYNYGSGAFHGTVMFTDPSGSFYCPQAGNPFTVPPMTNGEPGEYTMTVYFVPMVEGDFACTLSLCAECDPLVISALALNPNTIHAAPVEPGEPTGGSSSESHGNFWGENDYSIPGFGGFGPEVVLAFQAEAVLTIDLVLASPGTPELGLALLNGASPDSCIAVAVSQPDGTRRLEWVVEPGEYYLVLDGNVESFDYELMVEAVGVQEPVGLSKEFTLLESYPNPFNPTTTILWMQPETGSASLAIFNILGGVVHQAELGLRQPGLQDYTWDASSLSTGAYFVQVRFQGQTQLTKVLLVK